MLASADMAQYSCHLSPRNTANGREWSGCRKRSPAAAVSGAKATVMGSDRLWEYRLGAWIGAEWPGSALCRLLAQGSQALPRPSAFQALFCLAPSSNGCIERGRVAPFRPSRYPRFALQWASMDVHCSLATSLSTLMTSNRT